MSTYNEPRTLSHGRINTYLPWRLTVAIRRLAEQEDRSMSYMVRILLREAIEQRQRDSEVSP